MLSNENKRNVVLFFLLVLTLYLLVFYSWFDAPQPQELGSSFNQTASVSYIKSTQYNANLIISNFDISLSELKDIDIHLNLIIKNIGEEKLDTFYVIFPWYGQSDLMPMVQNVQVSNGVSYEDKVSEFVFTTNKTYAFPMQFQRKDKKYSSLGVALVGEGEFSFIHSFGRAIKLNLDNPIRINESRNIEISFKLDGATFGSPSFTAELLDKIIPASPINYYPLETNRFKLTILFPEFKTIDLNEIYITLPKGYSTLRYKPNNFQISSLNRELTPESAEGVVSFIENKRFDINSDCLDVKTDLWEPIEINDSIYMTKKAEGCVLNYSIFPSTEQVLNGSFNWYLSAKNPAVRDELYLMRFKFNPTFHPIGENVAGFMVLSDYKIKWWNFLIPLLIIILTIIIALFHFNSEENKLQKIAFLIPFILAMFTYWLPFFSKSPPLHPNLVDIAFLVSLFIAVISIMGIQKKHIFKGTFSFFISFILTILSLHFSNLGFSNLGDLFIKLAIAYPIISFSSEYRLISIILVFPFVNFLNSAGVESKFVWLWFFRLASLALLFPYVSLFVIRKINSFVIRKINSFVIRKINSSITGKINLFIIKKIKTKRFTDFTNFYLTFTLIWNFYYIISFFMGAKNGLNSFFNYFIFLPIILYTIYSIENYFLRRWSQDGRN